MPFALRTTMEEPTCLVVCNGPWPMPSILAMALDGPNIVVACDGAVVSCMEHGVQVNAVIGDFDSLNQDILSSLDNMEVLERPEQESNDLSKALSYAVEQGHTSVRVVGATGGDMEHEWANMLECAHHAIDIEVVDERGRFCFLAPNVSHAIRVVPQQSFSLMALVSVDGLNLTGASYPLTNDQLEMGSRGLHNMATSDTVKLDYGSGRLMLVLPH